MLRHNLQSGVKSTHTRVPEFAAADCADCNDDREGGGDTADASHRNRCVKVPTYVCAYACTRIHLRGGMEAWAALDVVCGDASAEDRTVVVEPHHTPGRCRALRTMPNCSMQTCTLHPCIPPTDAAVMCFCTATDRAARTWAYACICMLVRARACTTRACACRHARACAR